MKESKRKIIFNASFLYIRIFITTLISLYTTRILLVNLGISDYGIYNIIAGIVTLFSFIGNALISSTQRHLSYSMVSNSIEKITDIFNASVRIQMLIAFVIIVFGETVGLYLVYNVLEIPSDRLKAAIFIYHCVVFIFSINVLIIPYHALINAKEDMHIIAFVSVLESVGKLIIAFFLAIVLVDRLEFYGLMLLLLTVLVTLFVIIYCKKHYVESIINLQKIQFQLYKDLFSFAGWTLGGTIASLIRNQGTTIFLNVFGGPIANASYGIASQIGNNLSVFASTILKAVNPQIVKSYGQGNREDMFFYINASSRFSFYLFIYLFIPLFLEMDFILNVWLKSVPDYAIIFSVILLLNSMVDILIGPLITAVQATGNIKYYQITSGLIFLLNLPIVYFLLKSGYSLQIALVSNCIFTIFQGIARLFFLKRLIQFPIMLWMKNVLVRSVIILFLSIIVVYPVYFFLDKGWIRLLLVFLTGSVICSLCIYLIGINKQERGQLKILFCKVLKRYGINKE